MPTDREALVEIYEFNPAGFLDALCTTLDNDGGLTAAQKFGGVQAFATLQATHGIDGELIWENATAGQRTFLKAAALALFQARTTEIAQADSDNDDKITALQA